jgi:very-short-patch-repair endonuclease
VLFVSEKMAALDVVQRRLDAIGLGPFCLQLHSAKAKKSEVLNQLRTALNSAHPFTEEEWQREAERLQALRSGLNDLVKALHRIHPNGLTVRGATDCAIRFRQWMPASMPWTDPDTHDRASLDRLRETIRAMPPVVAQLGSLKNHPLILVQHSEWSNGWEDQLFNAAASLDQTVDRLQQALTALQPSLGTALESSSKDLLDAIERLVDPLLMVPQVPAGIAERAGDAGTQAGMQSLREHGERRQSCWKTLSRFDFKLDVARANGEELSQAWSAASLAWWPLRWFRQRGVTARLAMYLQNQQRPVVSDMPAILDALRGLNDEDQALNAAADKASDWLGAEYQGPQTDWSAVGRYEQWSKALDEALNRFAAASSQPKDEVAAALKALAGNRRRALEAGGELAVKLNIFRAVWKEFQLALNTISALASSGKDLKVESHIRGMPAIVRSTVAGWMSMRRSIRSWCKWRQLRAQALDAGMATVIAALEQERVSAAELVDYAEYSYQVWWLKAVTDREPVLRNFSSADHDRRIGEFKQSDERFQELTRQYVTAVLARKVPRPQAGQKSDAEMALLQRELAKQKAHLPVRKLVHGIPTLLPRLKPCLLMSPLSVAQYLDAAHASFDVVVFDEASQILVWDAVGAIARGKQLVVVGDPKQLPPTSFFARGDEDDAIADDEQGGPVKDLESILDECLGAGLPTLRLEWHYRSRHESLITFSNHRYYESRLITFPSPVTQDAAVRLEIVAGVYDRGATRTNRVEADAIVRAVMAHFHDDARRNLTLGIVTFNQTQQRLIETLLDEELHKSPELEQRIAEHGPEKLFIKNLENVQGDERDLILFSIAYGKDAAGRMPMNFGPLNKEGGHRRLNVAITRARVGVTIFSSIRPEDIDLSRTRATGVIDLKNYLEFAQKGVHALVEQSLPTGREPDSPFEMDVIRALRDKGWTVHPQVGCSGYRVDIGVVHPDKPGTYLMGVECDGASYHAQPTARDRDRLRQLVLEGLGWKLHRIWSTDWWIDPERELERLDAALRAAIEQQAHLYLKT